MDRPVPRYKLRSREARPGRRRRAERDRLWPDAEEVVFKTVGGGWSQAPRTLPLLAMLIDHLQPKRSAGRLYVALWSYEFGDGFVELPDPATIAYEAGFGTARGARSYTERMHVLRRLGFIRTAPIGVHQLGYALLIDPHAVAAGLHQVSPQRFPDSWWTAFEARCSKVGIALPGARVAAGPLPDSTAGF
jgi:hypothetical protein